MKNSKSMNMTTCQIFTLILLLISSSSSSPVLSQRCQEDDKNTLLQIQKDLHIPYWNLESNCCDGNVVGCDEQSNRVTKFVLTKFNLNLPIPASVGNLPFLQTLVFHHDNATGEIPQSISKLSELTFLDLRRNLLTGPIPAFLGHLKRLSYIGLSFNTLTGSIPASLSQLPELDGLLLDRNRLTGSIPESFADFKQKDFYLYLSHNQLSGPIPRKLGYTNFTLLDVSRNRLEGDISFLFGKNKSLNTADFSRNLFQFDLSNVKFSDNLANLDLNHNKIYGSLPGNLGSSAIVSFNVSYNRLCGPLPKLRPVFQPFDYTVFFHNKCLCGKPLPDCK